MWLAPKGLSGQKSAVTRLRAVTHGCTHRGCTATHSCNPNLCTVAHACTLLVRTAKTTGLLWCRTHDGTRSASYRIPKAGRPLTEREVHCLLWLIPQRTPPGAQPRLCRRGRTGGCSICFLVPTLASCQSPLTTRCSRDFSEPGIRAVQCYDCPTIQCGSRHDTWVGGAKSEARGCSGSCRTRGVDSVRWSMQGSACWE